MAKKDLQALVMEQKILNRIYVVRGEKIMLDKDLAELYRVETRVLKQAVKRNMERFPKDFMFEMTSKEIDGMVSQNVIPSKSSFGFQKDASGGVIQKDLDFILCSKQPYVS